MSFIPAAPPKDSPPSADHTSGPRTFVIPDLISYCALDLRVHEESPRAVWESKAWMLNGSSISRNENALNAFHGLKAGGPFSNGPFPCVCHSEFAVCIELTCTCYPLAPLHRLRVCCDIMNWLWHLDDLSDKMDDKSTIAIKNEITAIYNNPDTCDPKTDVGKLTKRFESFTRDQTSKPIQSPM